MQVLPIGNKTEFFQRSVAANGIFGSREWLEVYGSALQLKGFFTEDNKLMGGYYFLESKKFGLRHVKLPPYTPHCGFFFETLSSNRSAQLTTGKEAMQTMADQLKQLGAQICTLAFPPGISDMQPFIWNKFKVIPNYTYRINLQNDLNLIRGNFDTKTRNTLNKASKETSEIKENAVNGKQLFDFFSAHLKAAGANVYKKELGAILNNFANPGNSFYFASYLEGVLVAAVFCVYDSETAYYLLGAADRNKKNQGLNTLLLYKCIEKAKLLGCKTFDFEGSMIKGVEKFFRGFGGELIPYYTINKASLPIEMVLKLRNRERF